MIRMPGCYTSNNNYIFCTTQPEELRTNIFIERMQMCNLLSASALRACVMHTSRLVYAV